VSSFEDSEDISIWEEIHEKVKVDLPIVDLYQIKEKSSLVHNPRLLADLCLGYLKIGKIDKSVQEKLLQLSIESLPGVVEQWITEYEDTPS